jgi:hypothetical protein
MVAFDEPTWQALWWAIGPLTIDWILFLKFLQNE